MSIYNQGLFCCVQMYYFLKYSVTSSLFFSWLGIFYIKTQFTMSNCIRSSHTPGHHSGHHPSQSLVSNDRCFLCIVFGFICIQINRWRLIMCPCILKILRLHYTSLLLSYGIFLNQTLAILKLHLLKESFETFVISPIPLH